MTARGDVDLVMREWMAATAHVVEPEGLHDGVVARVPLVRQRPGWLAGRAARSFGRGRQVNGRVMSLVAAAAAITVAALVWSVMPGAIVPDASETPAEVLPPSSRLAPTHSAPSTDPPPRPGAGRATRFFPPFDYVIPEGSRLVPVDGDEHLHMIRWLVDGEYGVTVASGQLPWAHGSRGRFGMSGTPTDVVERLQEKGGLDLGTITPLELDAMPALAGTVDDREATDIHVTNESLPYVNYFKLDQPSLLIVSSIDGNVIFITIWAPTAESRDAFLPTAMQFVESIDFLDLPAASGDPRD